MTDFIAPGQPGSKVNYATRYDHWINGEYVKPDSGQYFENVTPVTGKVFCEVARGNAKDIDKALDAAHAAAPAWGKTSATERALILNKIADRMEANVEAIAVAETWENGKPIREALYVDIPLAIDHFRYFAAAIRAQEGSAGELDHDTVAYHFHEPLGVVGQIIPWNFPILMAVWKLAPAMAAGNCVVLKPAEQTPVSILFLMDVIKDLLPPGVVNIVNGFGVEAGKFAVNQGEVCTCPSRGLVEAKIYDKFMGDVTARTKAIKMGNPLDLSTMMGAQASTDQLEKILSYLDIGKKEGAKVITGGERADLGGELAGGYYVMPTIFEGNNKMRIFQEEIFGPVVSVTKFDGFDNAMEIANDTLYGLGAGVWTRDMNTAYRAGRAIQAGRVWTNCYHAYPAGAAFGGYKASGIGRENHKMMLDHYQQTKNLLVSYSPNKLGFF